MKTKYRQNHFLQVFSNCITCQLRDFQILWKTTALFLISFRIRVKTASPNKELTSCEWIGKRNTRAPTLFLARAKAQHVPRQSIHESRATFDGDRAFESKIFKLFQNAVLTMQL